MIAGYLGFKPKVPDVKNAVDLDDPNGIGRLIREHPTGVVMV